MLQILPRMRRHYHMPKPLCRIIFELAQLACGLEYCVKHRLPVTVFNASPVVITQLALDHQNWGLFNKYVHGGKIFSMDKALMSDNIEFVIHAMSSCLWTASPYSLVFPDNPKLLSYLEFRYDTGKLKAAALQQRKINTIRAVFKFPLNVKTLLEFIDFPEISEFVTNKTELLNTIVCDENWYVVEILKFWGWKTTFEFTATKPTTLEHFYRLGIAVDVKSSLFHAVKYGCVEMIEALRGRHNIDAAPFHASSNRKPEILRWLAKKRYGDFTHVQIMSYANQFDVELVESVLAAGHRVKPCSEFFNSITTAPIEVKLFWKKKRSLFNFFYPLTTMNIK